MCTAHTALQTREDAVAANFRGHIVVLVFADSSAPLIGLRSFVMPLRSSNLHRKELRPLVFVGNLEFFRREWNTLANFPRIFLLPVRTRLHTVLLLQYCTDLKMNSSIA